CANGFTGLDYW
nr:immunoglobulin heavy chain junction region [Macaca mulatta]MOV53673.1 immunoglobulin heavy chain junction region [Macaca mulatta]MOV53767.1 immunoglobulin heavy chain junction region [Macaca mulatta]MOV54009.1 immunoglobulin heavy chain junction region [Macaca mulatta]MOV54296.1 immunoglobulin heavy chain junction region [Macaca mulatta]